jgi:type I restriction enzyme R subunit
VLQSLFGTLMRETAPRYVADIELPVEAPEAAAVLRETAPEYLPLARGWDDKAKERAIAYFADPERREHFYAFFRQLESLYEILSPDAFLRPFMPDYQALAALYGLIRNAYSSGPYVDKELTAKTRALLRGHIESGALELPAQIHTLGPAELAALRHSGAADTTKVLNLRKILAATVAAESASQPFLVSIGERAEAIAQLYEDRRISTQQALADFERLTQEYVQADAERRQLGIDENAFAIYTTLKAAVPTVTAEQAQALNALFVRYPDYGWNTQHASSLRTELYKAVRALAGPQQMIALTNALMKLQRV